MDDDLGVPLKEFAKDKTQPVIANLLGVTQGAVSQMLNSERDIRVRALVGGSYQAIEIRPVGCRRKVRAA